MSNEELYLDSSLDSLNEDELNEELPTDRFNNYLLSWLEFNKRVLNEAKRKSNPIVERLNFIGIADSNLDEFIRTKFRDNKYLKNDIYNITTDIEKTYDQTMEELKDEYGIAIVHPSEMDSTEAGYHNKIKKVFQEKLYPLLQPLQLTNELPMPDIDDGGLFIVTKLEKDGEAISSIIKLPEVELIEINYKGSKYKKVYCINTDLVEQFIPLIYKGSKVIWSKIFRVYRKIDSLNGTKENNYISSIKDQLKERKNAKVMLVDIVHNINGIKSVVGKAKKRYRKYPFGLSYLKNIKDYIDVKSNMVYEKAKPRVPVDFMEDSIFEVISESDRLVHFPYEDFRLSTVRLLEEAAVDKKVKCIKQTLYRVSKDSRLIKALIDAANNGKQVTVLLELKAKMDEQHNIELIEKLKSSGCNLIFGPVELKTHAKVTLVIREENGKLHQYCNIATGNFNESTAKVYEDFSYFCKDRSKFKIGKDMMELFNFLAGCTMLDKTNELLVSPFNFRSTIEEEIDKCIEYAKTTPDSFCGITIKCNAFTDKQIAEKLYEASSAGVIVKCIIRGMCILLPGNEEFSKNIKVISIVGRYLEHSRIYQFQRGMETNTYIGSGDIMPRNLDKRVEVLIPIKPKSIRNKISGILLNYFNDTTNSYKLVGSTYSIPVDIENNESEDENKENPFSIQNHFINEYKSLEKLSIK